MRPTARALLEAGRGRSPVTYDVALGRARHRAWIEGNAPLPSWADDLVSGKGSNWLSSIVVKSLLTVVGLGLVVAAMYGSAPTAVHQTVKPPVLTPSAATPVAIERAPVIPEQPPSAAQAVRPIAATPEVNSARAMRKRVSAARPRPSAKTHAALPPTSVTTVTAVAPEPSAPPSPKTTAIVTAAPADAPASARETHEPAAKKSKPEAPIDVQEMRELAAAEKALAQNPQRTLELVARSEQRFPDGYLRPERAYVGILALVGLGRIEQARAEASRFFVRYPNTPYAARIRHALQPVVTKKP